MQDFNHQETRSQGIILITAIYQLEGPIKSQKELQMLLTKSAHHPVCGQCHLLQLSALLCSYQVYGPSQHLLAGDTDNYSSFVLGGCQHFDSLKAGGKMHRLNVLFARAIHRTATPYSAFSSQRPDGELYTMLPSSEQQQSRQGHVLFCLERL